MGALIFPSLYHVAPFVLSRYVLCAVCSLCVRPLTSFTDCGLVIFVDASFIAN
jgi:hypothetical protein